MSTSTDSPASPARSISRGRWPGPLTKATAAFSRTGGAVTGRVSRFLAAPGWRRTKSTADVVLLIVVTAAFGWTACNAVFLGTRAVANRGVAVVHLGGQPEVQVSGLDGVPRQYAVLPGQVLTGVQRARISIAIANDSPDGVVIKPGTLSGPFLTSQVVLTPDDRTGYILGNGTIHFVGTVTVDCDAAAAVARTLVEGGRVPQQPPTAVSFSLRDTNKVMHTADLVIDTTAAGIQGRVCTR